MKYFAQEGEKWRSSEEIRRMVSYRPFNLLDSPAALGPFDVVFCRTVLIYFDQPTKGQVLARVAQIMPPDGFLNLGGAGTVTGLSHAFGLSPGPRRLYRATAAAAQPTPTTDG